MHKIVTLKNNIINSHYTTDYDKIIKNLEAEGYKVIQLRLATKSEMANNEKTTIRI